MVDEQSSFLALQKMSHLRPFYEESNLKPNATLWHDPNLAKWRKVPLDTPSLKSGMVATWGENSLTEFWPKFRQQYFDENRTRTRLGVDLVGCHIQVGFSLSTSAEQLTLKNRRKKRKVSFQSPELRQKKVIDHRNAAPRHFTEAKHSRTKFHLINLTAQHNLSSPEGS